MKKHVITLAKKYPKGSINESIETCFKELFLNGIKIHTIRKNYPFWQKRIQEIVDKKAILCIREWSKEPYRSKQDTIKNLDHFYDVGYQKIVKKANGFIIDDKHHFFNHEIKERLAENDGLSVDAFDDWFKDVEIDEELIIIHFTNFRYYAE